ncbi:hypothetical protein CHLNCDRAFT_137972 [Chlorella variabilis]|uniref:Glycosyltransferase 61 catalytic domain-containing protein n=1 Tax=Chlorella variabilis TaxID=554065 RepID=E1Z4Z2_CHLVA|nr:hypothetical protein CHLNCDRAFT_137972 [Chlorella variabilis]EFN59144.1 hypothetical protein CHLNCDRAFT_137972 [Chlorella variabilis]|eukprot:XP_005851246.1 hypothetical protein CHLNCDRAFT_137972 [Chlorella variabilis]
MDRSRTGAQLVAAASLCILVLGAPPAVGEALRLQPSSYSCPEGRVPEGARLDAYRSCTFTNLYLWQGRAYYVLSDDKAAAPALGQLGLKFEMWASDEGPEPVTEFFEVTTADALAQRLPAAAAGQAATVPLAYYHFMEEWLPGLSMTLCEQFGHCSYADRSRLQLIDVQQRPRSCNSRELYPAFFREAAGCLSAKPLLHINGSSLRGQLARVEEAWMGLGPRCRGIPAGCYVPGSGRLPPTPQLTASLRLILAQCLGARLDAPAPLRPVQVLVIDRPYTSNRQRRYPPDRVAVRLAYMEGLSVRQQAQLWSGATVVLHMHGAALGNYFFLPSRAVVVQLAPSYRLNPSRYSRLLERDLAGVSDIRVVDWSNSDPTRLHLNTEAITADTRPGPRSYLADRERYAELATSFECSESLRPSLYRACRSLQTQVNLVLDLEVAANLTDAAIAQAFRQQQQAVPAWLAALRAGAGGAAADGRIPPAAAAAAEQERRRIDAVAAGLPLLERLRGAGPLLTLALGVAVGAAATLVVVSAVWRIA